MDNGKHNGLYESSETNTLKDYIRLIRNHWLPVLLISLTGLAVAIIYAENATDIYESTTTLRISKSTGDVLTSPFMPEFTDWGNDRFIANEIEVMTSYATREKVASTLIDSFYLHSNSTQFSIILNYRDVLSGTQNAPKTIEDLAGSLGGVSIDQKRGLDILEISVESPSPYEATLIANTYAEQYTLINLDMNRNQLHLVTEFLKEQRIEKQQELNDAEETLKDFQEKGGLIALDERASSLISILADFEAQKSATQVDLMASNKVLENLRQELESQNPRMADYLKSLSSQTYITAIQDRIVKMEINRKVALSKDAGSNGNSAIVRDYDRKIVELQQELDKELQVLKAGIFASSPQEVKELTQKIIEEEVRNQALQTSINELDKVVKSYEARFMKLPKNTLELAR
ncbi:MAG: hypothetical protein IH949_13740, partial [Bacteroidetes bacterium]|nr:hypothetical protein [Bacteroidota bacterium]